jgi:hypothetical protein
MPTTRSRTRTTHVHTNHALATAGIYVLENVTLPFNNCLPIGYEGSFESLYLLSRQETNPQVRLLLN